MNVATLLHCGDVQSTEFTARAHVLRKYRTIFKTCHVCGTRSLWPLSMMKCDECSFACHKKCASRTNQMTVCSVTDPTTADGGKNGAGRTENSRNSQTDQWKDRRRRRIKYSSYYALRPSFNSILATRMTAARSGRNDPRARSAELVAIANGDRNSCSSSWYKYRDRGTFWTWSSVPRTSMFFCYRFIVENPFASPNSIIDNAAARSMRLLRTAKIHYKRQCKSSSVNVISRKPISLSITNRMTDFSKTKSVAKRSSFKDVCSFMTHRHRVWQRIRNNFGLKSMSPVLICEL